jgi:hypothetical protein
MNYYFIGLMVAVWLYAFIAGGRPEKVGATIYTLSCIATQISYDLSLRPAWASPEIGVFVIDILTLGLFVSLALRADRFWPIWVSALLGLGVLGHLARMAEPGMISWTYAVSISIWSYPILAGIAIGSFNHNRKKARAIMHKSRAAST